MIDPTGAKVLAAKVSAAKVLAAHDDGGTGNPDPTMNPSDKSPKGENMPPAGGESISPAGSERPSRPNDHGAAPGDKDGDDAAG